MEFLKRILGSASSVLKRSPLSALDDRAPRDATFKTDKDASEVHFSAIVQAVRDVLKPLGYTKQGAKFRVLKYGNLGLIQFQRSQFNSGDEIKFTINVSIVSSILLKNRLADFDIKKASEWHGHVRQRIGFFSDKGCDLWWTISSSSDVEAVIKETVMLVSEYAAPFIEANISNDGMLKLWESGRALGVTEPIRLKYLEELRQGSSSRES